MIQSQAEIKVLQSQDDQCFLKCMKLLYNDQIQFYYLLEDYRSLAQLLPSLDADGFMVIVTNILANMLQVKNNGFLSCQKLDLSFEHIYVDMNTYKVKLVYLPVNQGFYMDDASCENTFRTSLIILSHFILRVMIRHNKGKQKNICGKGVLLHEGDQHLCRYF